MDDALSRSLNMPSGHGGHIASLAAELRVPLHEVSEIYRAQFERLAAEARIESFLGVLAARHTRSILRDCGRISPGGHR